MNNCYLRTLGHLSLHGDGPDGPLLLGDAKALAVLAYLATTPDGTAERSHLAQLFWPRKEISRARAGLRQALYYLRQKTPEDVELVRSDADRLGLDRRQLRVDLWEFEEALAEGAWERVAALHDGAFLAGYSVPGGREFRQWRDSQDDGIRAGAREAYRSFVTTAMEAGEPDRAVDGARRWVELNPLDEEAQTSLVRALAASGDRAGAFRAYESYRSLLREELGESPGPKLSRTLEELRSLASGEEGEGTWSPAAPSMRGSAAPADDEATTAGIGHAVVVISAAAILLLGAVVGWPTLDGGSSKLADLDTPPRITLNCEDETGNAYLRRLLLHGDSVETASHPMEAPNHLPSPTGDRYALSVASPEGNDLAVADSGTREFHRLTSRSADESPLAWSPDGRWIVYGAGSLEAEDRYVRRYRVHAAADTVDVPLQLPVMKTELGAAWSPRGTRIALVSDSAGNADIWTINPDGTESVNLTGHHAGEDRDPAWSPAGDRLAFVSDRPGASAAIWVMDTDGSDSRPIPGTRGDVRDPRWLSPQRLTYLKVGPGPAVLHEVSLLDGSVVSVAQVPDCSGILFDEKSAESERWIESVTLPGSLDHLSPGQWVRRNALVRDASGTVVSAEDDLSWSSSDSSVVDVDAEPGWVRVRGTGEALVRATLRGWRGDSARVVSRPVTVRSLSPAFSEDWSTDPNPARWVTFGFPAPARVETGGEVSAALLNNGDENWDSGLVTTSSVDARRGLTIEVWGRVRLTARLYQHFAVGLVESPPDEGDPAWRNQRVRLALDISGNRPDSTIVTALDHQWYVPWPDSLGTWHRYAMQVDTAGWMSIVVDGRLHWRSPHPVDLEHLDDTHLALYGRSKDTRILHGPVRIYEGVRYRY